MTGHTGHRFKKLTRRRTKAALAARHEKMKKGGTWRQDMVNQLNQTFLAVAKVTNRNQEKNDARFKWISLALVLLALVVFILFGHMARWW